MRALDLYAIGDKLLERVAARVNSIPKPEDNPFRPSTKKDWLEAFATEGVLFFTEEDFLPGSYRGDKLDLRPCVVSRNMMGMTDNFVRLGQVVYAFVENIEANVDGINRIYLFVPILRAHNAGMFPFAKLEEYSDPELLTSVLSALFDNQRSE